jgi:superfamily II DNA helicase RecQ
MLIRRENIRIFVTRKHPRSCDADLVHMLPLSSAMKVFVFCRMRDEAERVSKTLNRNCSPSVAYNSAIDNIKEAIRQFESRGFGMNVKDHVCNTS